MHQANKLVGEHQKFLVHTGSFPLAHRKSRRKYSADTFQLPFASFREIVPSSSKSPLFLVILNRFTSLKLHKMELLLCWFLIQGLSRLMKCWCENGLLTTHKLNGLCCSDAISSKHEIFLLCKVTRMLCSKNCVLLQKHASVASRMNLCLPGNFVMLY